MGGMDKKKAANMAKEEVRACVFVHKVIRLRHGEEPCSSSDLSMSSQSKVMPSACVFTAP